MSEIEARKLIESAEQFVQDQRAQREFESRPAYARQGSHVTIGEPKLLSPDFIPSHESDPVRNK